MTASLKIGALVVACGLAIVFVKDRERQAVARAFYEQRDAARADSLTRLAHWRDSATAAFRRDTVRLTRLISRWDTVKAGVDSIFMAGDTIRVPVEVVREVVQSADSTIRACRAVVRICAERADSAERETRLWRSRWTDLTGQQPGFLRRHLSVTVGYGVVAYRSGQLVAGPSLVAGWRRGDSILTVTASQ